MTARTRPITRQEALDIADRWINDNPSLVVKMT